MNYFFSVKTKWKEGEFSLVVTNKPGVKHKPLLCIRDLTAKMDTTNSFVFFIQRLHMKFKKEVPIQGVAPEHVLVKCVKNVFELLGTVKKAYL